MNDHADRTRPHERLFFSKRELRTLEKFADVAIEGHDEDISPRRVAANIDRQVARVSSKRTRGIKLVLFLVEYVLPLLSLRLPFSWLSKASRKRLIDRKIATPHRRGPLRSLSRNLAQTKILFLTGYYGDADTFKSVHYIPPTERPKYDGKLKERGLDPVRLHVPSGSVVDADVCVIGSGAGGAVAAYHAALAGRDVVLVEEGPYLHGMDEISHDEGEMSAKLYKEGGLQTTLDLTMGIQQGKCLGGSAFINNAICFRLGDEDLSPGRDDLLAQWEALGARIDKDKLAHSFGEVETMIKVRPLRDTQEPGLPPIDGANAQKLLNGWETLVAAGMAPADLKYGLFKKNYELCLGCGSCVLACRYERKLSMVETYLPKAAAAGARIIVGCHARKIETNGRPVTGVRCKLKDGSDLLIRAKKVVVSGGAIGSSVLLMRSGLGKNVGSRFSFNANTPMMARFPEPVDAFDGVQMGAYIDGRDFMLESWYGSPFAYSAIVPGWFGEHFKRMQAYNRYACAGVLVGTEHNGRVKRTAFFRDLLGPVKYTMTPDDLESLKRGMAQLALVYFAAGAEVVLPTSFTLNLEMKAADFKGKPDAIKAFIDKHVRRPDDLNLNSAHPQGGNPMSDDEGLGVVDSSFRVHGHDGLFVCDASVFPTSLGINPQLTIMAMADYFGRLGVL